MDMMNGRTKAVSGRRKRRRKFINQNNRSIGTSHTNANNNKNVPTYQKAGELILVARVVRKLQMERKSVVMHISYCKAAATNIKQ